jgi:hypothetical protein
MIFLNGQPVIENFPVLDSENVQVTGLVDGDFTKALFNPAGAEVSGSITVTISELGTGQYRATYTPDAVGIWYLVVFQATHFPEGMANSSQVTVTDLDEIATKADIAAATETSHTLATSGSIIIGDADGGTWADTLVRDGVYWIIGEDASNGITAELVFNIPDDDKPGVIDVFGRYIGTPPGTHYQELWAWNYGASAWEQLFETFMPGGMTSDLQYTHEYYERHIDRSNNNEVKIRIIHNITNYNGSHQLYLDQVQASSIEVITAADIAGAVWDEPLTGQTHNIATSSGRRLRELGGYVVYAGTAVGNGNGVNQIELNGDASDVDGAYDPSLVSIVDGQGAGQSRLILEYDGTTRIATVDRNWKVQPNGTSDFVITGDPGREHVNEGLARGGTSNTITLNALASGDDDIYIGQRIFIRSGKGEDQAGVIKSYDGANQIATLWHDWIVIPDNTTGYTMIPDHIVSPSDIWDDPSAKRLLGLMHENITIDEPEYDAHGNLTGARVRIYSNAGSVGTDSDVLATYAITAPSDAPGQFTTWNQVKI